MMSAPNLEQELKAAFDRHTGKTTPANLAEAMAYSLLAPGKRIRPRLALQCGEMIGLPREAVLPGALALEMIHCFTLIHDDLPCMDNDDFRRGRPSNHKQFGEGMALLAGDGLVPLALDVFLDCAPHVRTENLALALRRFAWATGPRGVIGGQAAEALLSPSSKRAEMDQMHAQKTGALFSAALLIPKDLAGISDHEPRGAAIDCFASELGLAFQIADDLEDGAKEASKPTSVLFYVSREEASRETAQRLRSACEGLSSAWGAKAQPLLAIADEVLRAL